MSWGYPVNPRRVSTPIPYGGDRDDSTLDCGSKRPRSKVNLPGAP